MENTLCEKCGKFFRSEEFDIHWNKNHTSVKCDKCNFIVKNSEEFYYHIINCKKIKFPLKCPYCSKKLTSSKVFKYHLEINECRNQIGGALPEVPEDSIFRVQKTAFKKFIEQYLFEPEEIFNDINEFFLTYRGDFKKLYKNVLDKVNNIKSQICLTVNFQREIEGNYSNQLGYFTTVTRPLSTIKFFNKIFYKFINEIETKVNEFTERGSGWIIESITKVEIRIGVYKPIVGFCSTNLPYNLKKKKAVLDLKSDDNMCFLYSIIAGLFKFKTKHQKYTVSYYKEYFNRFNLKRVQFPMKLKDIKKFEKDNKHLNISINVYEWTNKGNEIKPLLISKGNGKIINILYYNSHYSYIINFNRLIGFKSSAYHYYCLRCLAGFSTLKKKTEHMLMCGQFKAKKVVLPEEPDNILKFRDYSLTMPYDYIGYAGILFNFFYDFNKIFCLDFETVLEKNDSDENKKTRVSHIHKPCGYAFLILDYNGEVVFQDLYRGIDAAERFLQNLAIISKEILLKLKEIKPMISLSEEQEKIHKESTKCYLCNDLFLDDQIQTHDHCHRTGLYRGPAHVDCNLSYKVKKEIPIYMHNLKHYDANIIIKALSIDQFKECKIIPSTVEKFISFKLTNDEDLGCIKFLDSYNFMASSLATLTENLASVGENEFKITKKVFKSLYPGIITDDNFNILLRKGVYPYEWVDNFNKFQLNELPDKSKFYSSLTLEGITDKDYCHAQDVWSLFKCKTFGDYHNIYLMLDTSLLTDIFQKFRCVCLENYGLEPAAFYSLPGMSFSAALKYTKVELELLTDIDMVMFFEKSMRGGVCQVSKRHAIANNKYMENYNPSEESKFIFYGDLNNLYGCAMTNHMPLKDFQWLNDEQINYLIESGIENLDDESETGFFIECDLDYEEELHDEHNDYPVGPLKYKVPENELSSYQQELINQLKASGHKRVATEKLMLTLHDKKKYILHYRNLKLYLSLGLKLRKIYRVLSFKQTKWLKPFIDLNTKLRKNAKNTFESDFFKLVSNVFFGKTVENVRQHKNVKLALNKRQIKNFIKKPEFESFNIIGENKAVVNMQKNKIKIKNPLYIGTTVLELSKNLMYNYHYKVFKKFYKDKIKLLYTGILMY